LGPAACAAGMSPASAKQNSVSLISRFMADPV
jgi:hypothetical protein